jgi:hypothetical protein
MSEMTLEEAMRVLETATIYARGAEASRAYATVRAHAERTVEARSDEPEAVKRLREAPVWHLVTDYIDTLTADRDRLAACVERVRAVQRVHLYARFDGLVVEQIADGPDSESDGYMRTDDVLDALGDA